MGRPLSGRERVFVAMSHAEPDRVPHFEWIIDPAVIQGILPGASYFEFIDAMDIDGVAVSPRYEREWLDDTHFRDEWQVVRIKNPEVTSVPVEGPIRTLADLASYSPPPADAPGRFLELEAARAFFGDRKALIVHLNDVFSIPRNLLGMQTLLEDIVLDPELVVGLVDLSVKVNLELAWHAARLGADIIVTGDDIADHHGPLMSRRHFEELFYPGFRRVVAGMKDLGLKVFKHTDGNIEPILDLIVGAGVDGIDPIEPRAGMDIGTVKAAYGGRACLKGNVDCAHTLTFGTCDQVTEETRECIRKASPGGGHILSSSNSIHSGVRPENYRAMLQAVRTYGRYPIQVQG